MTADKARNRTLGSDLARLHAMRDEDIDYDDAPVPDLEAWVRNAVDFNQRLLASDPKTPSSL